MGVAAALGAALRISPRAIRRRGAAIAVLALLDRLAGPGVVYALVLERPLCASLLGALLIGALGLRGSLQRGFVARSEADLYRRAVRAVLGGDVLRPSLLPDEEARAGLFEGLHRVAVLLADTLPNFAANTVAALILAVAVAVVQPLHVSVVAALTLGIGGAALFASRRWVDRAQTAAWSSWDRVAEAVTDACEGRLDLVAAGRDGEFLARFEDTTRAWDDKARRAGRVAGALGRLPMALLAVAVGTAVVVEAWRQGQPWSIAGMQAGLLASTTPAFLGVARCLQELVSNEQRLRLVTKVMEAEGRGHGQEKGAAPPISPARVEWNAVRFAYGSDGREALRGVSLEWRSSELLAITGANGSGKSTCLRALLGLGAASQGMVRVDGVPLVDLDIMRWRRSIAFLPQRPYIAPRDTVRECLRFADADIEEEVMGRALDRVGMLARLRAVSADPLGATVGDLSVGERQRIALARVLCRPAPLAVLDEPDANLDRNGIDLVSDLVVELARTRMVLVVAHTPELLRVADRVVTLEDGTVRSDEAQHPR